MRSEDVFRVKESFKLTQYGIPVDQCTWPRVTLSNSDLICVLHAEEKVPSEESMYSSSSKALQNNRVQIIHSNGKVYSRSKTIAESAKIHPTKPIIALKACSHYQVYNLETKILLNQVEVHSEVCFWKWANEEVILLVTETSVLQWMVFRDDSGIDEVCPRLPRLSYSEIVNCAVDEGLRWYSVTGLVDHGPDTLVEGITQIYSVDYGVAQCIEAHTTSFLNYKFDGYLYESLVMVAASRLLDSLNGKVHCIELGPSHIANTILKFSSSDLPFTLKVGKEPQHNSNTNCMDFPVSIQADKNHGVVYVLTKFGQLYLAELESAVMLASVHICSDITFSCSLDDLSNLTIASRSSQMWMVSIDWLLLIKYTADVLNKPELAKRLQHSRGMENVDLLH